MNLFNMYVFITLFLITILSVFFAIKMRKSLTHMPGMVITMYLGMNVGLTAGVLLGSIYQGNLFHSTILAMLIGMVAGTLGGFVLGLLPAIEGLMAGLMGGMMGAMLGEMIDTSQSAVMIKIFLTLSLCTIILFFILPTSLENNEIKSKQWFLKPFLSALIIVIYLIIGNQLESVNSKSTPQTDEQQQKHIH
jgi:hypothetical protein